MGWGKKKPPTVCDQQGGRARQSEHYKDTASLPEKQETANTITRYLKGVTDLKEWNICQSFRDGLEEDIPHTRDSFRIPAKGGASSWMN